jgi:hypothetical protein
MTDESDPVTGALVAAIRTGDLGSLQRLLAADPGLAAAPIGAAGGRTPCTWPPTGPAITPVARRSCGC